MQHADAAMYEAKARGRNTWAVHAGRAAGARRESLELESDLHRALAAGTTLHRVLELVAELRREVDVPLVLFGYYNPFFRYGVERLARDASAAGADAFLCVDLPPEEAGELRAAATAAGLDLIALLAPTTPVARVRRIARAASGFLRSLAILA